MDVNGTTWKHDPEVAHDPASILWYLFTALLVVLSIQAGFVIFTARWKAPPRWPEDIPWPGSKKGFVPWLWECFQGWPFLSPKLQKGYDQFNRFDQPFILPSFSLRPQVILPAKDMEWLMRLPDTVVSTPEIQNENLGLGHVFPLKRPISGEKVVFAAIHTHVNRHVSLIQRDVYDEMRAGLDREFGTDPSCWREVRVAKAMANVIQSVGARVVFGLPMCRDAKWVASAQRATTYLGAAMISGQLVPWFIQPVISPVLRYICDHVRMRCFNSMKPIFETWYEQILQEQRDGVRNPDVPYNFATSLMRTCLKADDRKRADLATMFTSILIMALLPFNGSALVSTVMMLDLASAAPEHNAYKILREEAAHHVQSEEDWVNFASFADMHHTDSAVKESLRMSPSQARALSKEVVHESGLTLPSGQHVDKGTWLGTATLGIHMDDRFYPDAKTYNPFRFVKKGSGDSDDHNANKKARVSTEPKHEDRLESTAPFLTFGAGRNRCSGQAFAIHLNKMVVAYMVTHYEFEPLSVRPANWEIGDSMSPPQNATLRFRRIVKN